MAPLRNPFMLILLLAVMLAIATGFMAFKLFESAEADIQANLQSKNGSPPPAEQSQEQSH